MKQYNQIKKLLLLGIPMVVMFFAAAFFQSRMNLETMNAGEIVAEEITVSLDSGFYQENQLVSVDVPKAATVYYTDTYEEPNAENGKEYTGPIPLVASDEETVHVYRFKAYYEDGRESKVVNRTYFMGSQIGSRYTTNVLHVAGDPEGLLGYENGIFVAGKGLDDFLEKNPDYTYGISVQGNFSQRGDESEREVYIEYFTQDGTSLLSQACGVRIFGNISRIKNMRSFRLYARKEYDEKNEFRYPVLPQFLAAEDGTIAQEHKRLILRSAGTDNGFAYIRSELAAQLASEAGFLDVMHAEPVCVYVNGMYYGIYWLENGFDDQYFVNRYGEHDGEFVVLSGSDPVKEPDEDPLVQSYVDEYNELYARFSSMDLTVEENYRELQEFLDVENYLQYFAIEYYVGNNDWPQGNVKAYRYVSPNNEYREGTVFDGRYRHMLFDMDFAFGLLLSPEQNLLDEIMLEEFPLFGAIMERQDCRDYFTSYVCDLFNGALSSENIARTLEEMHSSRAAELYYLLEETDITREELWVWEETAQSYEDYQKNHQIILDYAEARPGNVYEDVTATFYYDFATWYTLNVTKYGRSDLKINTIYLEDDAFSGHYIGDIPVVLTPVMAKNEVFDYWLVNGEVIEEEELVLTAKDILEGQIFVEMVVHNADKPVLQLNRIYAKGQSDYIEVINLSDKEIQTRGYYLSDCEDAYRYALPATVIAPGETQKYYGKDCMDVEALGQNAMNFNIKEGETITLTYREETLEAVVVPDLLENGVYQRDGDTGRFVEVLIEE